jgi:senataxin
MANASHVVDELLVWPIPGTLRAARSGQEEYQESCERVPDRFLDEREYISAFLRPSVLEMKAAVVQTLMTEQIPCAKVGLEYAPPKTETPSNSKYPSIDILARFVSQSSGFSIPTDTLCILTPTQGLNPSISMYLAIVLPGRSAGCVGLRVSSSVLPDLSRLSYIHPVESLVSPLRELDALYSISSVRLKEELLLGISNADSRNSPEVASRLLSLHHLPEGLMTALNAKLNPSQKEVIDTLCDLNLIAEDSIRDSPKIVLVQGPPGTGKTMTLNTVLNALHVQQYNAYYRSISDAVRRGKFALSNERSWLDLTKVAKPRIIVCAPSNVAIDNIILRVQADKFIDGHCRQYMPRLVRIGKGGLSNQEVAETALARLVERITSETGDEINTKINLLESQYSEYRHGVLVQVTKLHCMINGTPYLFREGIETRVTTNPAGMLVPYWADHEQKTTTSELPSAATASDPPGAPLEEMVEYVLYSQELMRFLELWEETHWKLQRYRLVRGFMQAGAMNSSEKHQLQQSLETLFMNEASIVCGTLNSTGLPQVRESSPFHTCVVDEAAQAVELSTLIPLRLGVERLVLIGDPQQLPATVLAKRELLGGNYERSLFERLEKCGVPVHTLDVQYRMHPEISVFPRNIFYQGKLADAAAVAKRPAPFFTLPPWNLHPFMFMDVVGARESTGGGSKTNVREANVCLSLYSALSKIASVSGAGSLGGKVGIISPYAEQVKLLREMFAAACVTDIEIATVDSFQGKEKDLIILSTVRASPESSSVGFLADVRRMNVAITRAKFGLFVVGNANTLSVNPEWGLLVKSAKSTLHAYIQVPPNVKDILELFERTFFAPNLSSLR